MNDCSTDVCVLLSSYNGERFIAEQIESILNQNILGLKIYIRDDGSKDSTREILKQYSKYTNVNLEFGNNIGVRDSFYWLVKNAPKCRYYAFCDQDDIWDNDKLSVAKESLEPLPQNVPNVYFSNVRLVNADGTFIKNWHEMDMANQNKFAAFLENRATGATMVFNYNALQMIEMGWGDDVKLHDWWLYLIGKFFGNVIYDNVSHMSYRQHDSNVVGANKKTLYKRIINLLENNSCPRLRNAVAFYKGYEEFLDDNDKDKI